jgi:LuxR family maltose regulon positive regulatory protein
MVWRVTGRGAGFESEGSRGFTSLHTCLAETEMTAPDGPAAAAGGSAALPAELRPSGTRPAVVSRPVLWDRLAEAARVTVVSAPPGSGKTVLLRSWISGAGLADRVAWVTVGGGGHDPQRFWLAVLGALRATSAGSDLVRELSAAPDLDGWALVERLLADLAPLRDRLWLVIDDLHELGSAEARRQLELLMMRAVPELRFVLVTRHDVRLGLHRLRLEGDLTEIRADDLRFSAAEARELLAAAGVCLPGPAVALLVDRTEGWAAGLRLAALSLAGHPDPGRLAAEFSGSERTVAEYLLAEVLQRQSEQVRRLLLRTSVLERVSGELADLLTGGSGGEGVLQDLEEANAFTVSLDTGRSWFRYHRLFAGLLQLELRRTEPDKVTALHATAAGWLAEHGYPVEAIGHAQAAQDWGRAARLLADQWPGLHLDGQAATAHALLAGFPAAAYAEAAELAVLAAADELAQGSLEAAERYVALADRTTAPAAGSPAGRPQLLLGVVRLLAARQRGNPPAVAEQARRLQVLAEDPQTAQADLGAELRALALVSLGTVEFWAAGFEEAERHLEQGVALARRVGRPFLEFSGLVYQAGIELFRSFPRAAERAGHAIELARRQGWTDDPAACYAYGILADVLIWQGRHDEADAWMQRVDRTTRPEAEPVAALAVYHVRGRLELARGRDGEALAAFQAAERLTLHLAPAHPLATATRAWLVHTLAHLGETDRAERVLARLGDHDRERGELRIAIAALRLAQGRPHAASAALAPVLDGSAAVAWRSWLVAAFLLEGNARDALGDQAAAERSLERALELAEPDARLLWFMLYPAPDLLERHARHGTAHAALVADILGLLAGTRGGPVPGRPQPLLEPLSKSEVRVLRYLPTHLSAPEIAAELSVSVSTVKTHMRNLYAKLGTHRRAAAVERARALGLLAPSRPRS